MLLSCSALHYMPATSVPPKHNSHPPPALPPPPPPQASVSIQMSNHYYRKAALNAYQATQEAHKHNLTHHIKTNQTAKTTLENHNNITQLLGGKEDETPELHSIMDSVQVDVRMLLMAAMEGWEAQVEMGPWQQFSTMRQFMIGSGYQDYEQTVIKFELTYRRSTFIKAFAVCIVLCMWFLSVYLFVLAVDHTIVRPRTLGADSIGFAVGMLFALPALRLLLEAPFGRWVAAGLV
jgi:hypothetical protein